jgi:predicted RNA binding protein YcfA (HicA-like mRNA interferase family)
MPPVHVLSGAQVWRILQVSGFVFASQKGSHMKLRKVENGQTVTAIVPDHKQLKPGTLSSIIRQSRLDRALFETRVVSFLDSLPKLNQYHTYRVEVASAFGAIVRGGEAEFVRLTRVAGSFERWEDVPEADRRIVEEAEAERRAAELQTRPYRPEDGPACPVVWIKEQNDTAA